MPADKPPACPICRRPSQPATRPFCSPRCRAVDLGRWLGESYAVPAEPDDPSGQEAE